MAVISKILGNSAPILEATSEVSRFALDAVYAKNAILLADLTRLFGLGASIPLPIVGFTYENPSEMELLKYEYSEYPYLNKTLITNSYTKQNTKLTIRSWRAITSVNGIVTNLALNEALFYGIEAYCDRGGTFTIMTMWGTYKNFVLENLAIIPQEGNQVAGIGFEWRFKRIPFDTANAQSVYSSALDAYSGGKPI